MRALITLILKIETGDAALDMSIPRIFAAGRGGVHADR
jgi:hypothetical protein